MSSRRSLLSITAVAVATSLVAQQEIKLINLAALQDPVILSKDINAKAGMQAQGIEQERMDRAMVQSTPAYWPIGLRTDSGRVANAERAKNLSVELVCTYLTPTIPMVILRIPAASNIHMPEDMRMGADFYLVVTEDDIIAVEKRAERPKASKGPSYDGFSKAKITKPDGIYATYDLSTDPSALAALESSGLSAAEIDAVVFRSQQRNWPVGMENFENRFPRLAEFKKFKAFSIAKWDGKVLLIIPAEENKKLDPMLRPYLDIYMVYEEESVAVVGKGR